MPKFLLTLLGINLNVYVLVLLFLAATSTKARESMNSLVREALGYLG